MKTKNVTFSIPIEVIDLLHSRIGKRDLSRFVTMALSKALTEESRILRAAYEAADKDRDRMKTIQDWSALESEEWDEE